VIVRISWMHVMSAWDEYVMFMAELQLVKLWGESLLDVELDQTWSHKSRLYLRLFKWSHAGDKILGPPNVFFVNCLNWMSLSSNEDSDYSHRVVEILIFCQLVSDVNFVEIVHWLCLILNFTIAYRVVYLVQIISVDMLILRKPMSCVSLLG